MFSQDSDTIGHVENYFESTGPRHWEMIDQIDDLIVA